jgi:hypothetical protein
MPNVPYGSYEDIFRRATDVRFAAESGHVDRHLDCPVIAEAVEKLR